MKTLLGTLTVVGIVFGGFYMYESNANAVNTNDYIVVMKFTSGNTMAFSDKYNGYDACINSPEYIINKTISNQSGAKILCTNELPTYK